MNSAAEPSRGEHTRVPPTMLVHWVKGEGHVALCGRRTRPELEVGDREVDCIVCADLHRGES